MDASTPTYRLIAAAILLGMYLTIACILLWLLYHPGNPAPAWDQVLVIFNAIGAIATTAAGVLLGVEIQRESVTRADRAADDAKKDAALKSNAVRTALMDIDALQAGAAAAVAGGLQAVRGKLRDALLSTGEHL